MQDMADKKFFKNLTSLLDDKEVSAAIAQSSNTNLDSKHYIWSHNV